MPPTVAMSTKKPNDAVRRRHVHYKLSIISFLFVFFCLCFNLYLFASFGLVSWASWFVVLGHKVADGQTKRLSLC